MSDEQEDKDLEEMRRLIEEQEAREKTQAATAVAEPEPQPELPLAPTPVETQAQTEQVPTPEPVTPTPTPAQPTNGDDPLKWADRKGLRTPEEIARAYQKLEQEFGRRNQVGHPGYQDLSNGNPAPQPQMPPPSWAPAPQMPQYGYPPPPPYPTYSYAPPPPNRAAVAQSLADKYGMDIGDVEKLLPMIGDMAEVVASRRTAHLESKLMSVERKTARTDELIRLSQDPAFLDPDVQTEIHKVFKSNPELLQRPGGYEVAFNEAIKGLYRQKLQQGSVTETTNRPPTTAGGGNGSANTAPQKITDAIFNSWTDAEQDAFMKSNGRIVPKR